VFDVRSLSFDTSFHSEYVFCVGFVALTLFIVSKLIEHLKKKSDGSLGVHEMHIHTNPKPKTETRNRNQLTKQSHTSFDKIMTDIGPIDGTPHYYRSRYYGWGAFTIASQIPSVATEEDKRPAIAKAWETLDKKLAGLYITVPFFATLELEDLMNHPYNKDSMDCAALGSNPHCEIMKLALDIAIQIAAMFFNPGIRLHADGLVPDEGIRLREAMLLGFIRELLAVQGQYNFTFKWCCSKLDLLGRELVPLLTTPGRFSDDELFTAIEIFTPCMRDCFINQRSFRQQRLELRAPCAMDIPIFRQHTTWLLRTFTRLVRSVLCSATGRHRCVTRALGGMGVHLHFSGKLDAFEVEALRDLTLAFVEFVKSGKYLTMDSDTWHSYPSVADMHNFQVEAWFLWALSMAMPENPEVCQCFCDVLAAMFYAFLIHQSGEQCIRFEECADAFMSTSYEMYINPNRFTLATCIKIRGVVTAHLVARTGVSVLALKIAVNWGEFFWQGGLKTRVFTCLDALLDNSLAFECNNYQVKLEAIMVLFEWYLYHIRYLSHPGTEEQCVALSEKIDRLFCVYIHLALDNNHLRDTFLQKIKLATLLLKLYDVPLRLEVRMQDPVATFEVQNEMFPWFRPERAQGVLGRIWDIAREHGSVKDAVYARWEFNQLTVMLTAFGASGSACTDHMYQELEFQLKPPEHVIRPHEMRVLTNCQDLARAIDEVEAVRWSPMRSAWVVGVHRACMARKGV
jgi:hypothetical protein